MKFSDFSGGMATDINESLMPESVVDFSLNMEFDVEIGSAVSRVGTSIVGAQLVDNVSVLGIAQHVDQADSTKNKLFAVVNDGTSPTNSDIYDVSAGTKSLQDDTHSLKTYFLNYQGDTLRLNGTDAPKAYNSSAWITSGGVFDLANMPTGYKYAIEFLDRVYLWGSASSPYTLAYSGLLTSGTVSWTSGNDTLEIEPEDGGGAPTGLGKVPGYILIFKERSMHRFDFNSAYPEGLVGIGAASQQSIVMGGALCAFYSASHENSKGFYVTDGGRPVCISSETTRPIKKLIDAISSDSAVAGWATEKVFAWSIGDITVDGETFTNVVLKYNRTLNQWSAHSYPSEFKCFCTYVTSGTNTIVGGDDDGTVFRVDRLATYADNGTAIRYRLRKKTRMGSNKIKNISEKLYVSSKNANDLSANITIDEGETVPLDQHVNGEITIRDKVRGTTFTFELTGTTAAARAYIRELDIPSVEETANYV